MGHQKSAVPTGVRNSGYRPEDEGFTEEQRAAESEKARRARESLEAFHKVEVERARRAAGQCVVCGRPLPLIARLLQISRHLGYQEFN